MGMLLAYYTILCHIPSKYGWGKCFLAHHYRVFLNEFLVLMIPCKKSRYSLFNGNGHWTSSGVFIGHTKHIFSQELPITLCSFATLILPAPFPSSIAAAATEAAAVATVKMAANHGLPVFIVFGIDDFPRRALV